MRVAVKSIETEITENVLEFSDEQLPDGKLPEPPQGLRYVEDRAVVAVIGEIQTDEELGADPAPPVPEPAPKVTLQALTAAILKKTGVTQADIDAEMPTVVVDDV